MVKKLSKVFPNPLIAIAITALIFTSLSSGSLFGAIGKRKSFAILPQSPPEFRDLASEIPAMAGVLCSSRIYATDPDGTIPTLTAFNLPDNASLSDYGDGSGVLSFIPNLSQVGRLTVGLVASDGALADTAWVTLVISEAPGHRRAPEFGSLPAELHLEVGIPATLVVSATDPDGLIPALSISPLPRSASFLDRGDGTGVFSITPAADQVGRLTITLVASDGVLADTATVVIVIFIPDFYPDDTIEGLSFQTELIASDTISGTIDQIRAEDLDGDGLAEILFRVKPPGGVSHLDIWDPATGDQVKVPTLGEGIKGYSLRSTTDGLEPLLWTDSNRILVENLTQTGWDSIAALPAAARQFQWAPDNPRGWQICYQTGNSYSSTTKDPMGTCTYYNSSSSSDTWMTGVGLSATKWERIGNAFASPNGARSLRQIVRTGSLVSLLIPSVWREDETKSGYCMPTRLFNSSYILCSFPKVAESLVTLRTVWAQFWPDFYGPYPQANEYLVGLGLWNGVRDSTPRIAYVDHIYVYWMDADRTTPRWRLITIALDGERLQTVSEFTLQPHLTRGGITRIDADSSEAMIVAADSGLAYVLSIPDATVRGRLRLPRSGEFLTAYALDTTHRDLVFTTASGIEVYRVKPAVPARLSPMTIRVPDDRPTIQSGINAAQHGDTVLVAAETYVENIDFLGKRIVVLGAAGPARPSILPRDTTISIVRFGSGEAKGTEFCGFSIVGGGVSKVVQVVNGAEPVIRGNVFTQCRGSGTIIVAEVPHLTVSRNLFADNPGKVAIDVVSGSAEIINNTFDRNWLGIRDIQGVATIRNNIITNSKVQGVDRSSYIPATGALDYNDVWNNHPNYKGGARAGERDFSFDPLYDDTSLGFYTLNGMSPCIDNGDPDSAYDDPDGTIADLGAFPFHEQGLPRAVHLRVLPAPFWRVTDRRPTFHWTFYDTGGVHQIDYQLEVGTDNDWSYAESWSTGELASGDSSAVYGGSELTPGATYHYRIRVHDAISWGNWAGSLFHINAVPSVPGTYFPVSGGKVNVSAVQLHVLNSTDLDLDSLKYDFEVYADSGIADLVFREVGVAEQSGKTKSHLLSGLDTGRRYWWRARVYDGYTHSDWCSPESFRTQSTGVIHVPADQATLQMGVLAAADGDTVLAAPGEYRENIDLLTKGIVLRGSDGAKVTTISAPNHGAPVIDLGWRAGIQTTIANLTIKDGSVGIRSSGDSISILDNVFSGNGQALSISYASRFVIRGNRMYDEAIGISRGSGGAICYNVILTPSRYEEAIYIDANAEIYNNTIDVGGSCGIRCVGGTLNVRNNIIFNATGVAVVQLWGRIAADYNCLFGNASDYYAIVAGAHDIHQYAGFVNSSARNYALLPTSPCINAGDPDPRFNDPDGTRNDIGAIPYGQSVVAGSTPDTADISGVVLAIRRMLSAPANPDSLRIKEQRAAEISEMIRRLFGAPQVKEPASSGLQGKQSQKEQ